MPACAPYAVVAVAGDDAGDVRAVAVVVVGLRLVVDEVDKLCHALIVDRADLGRSALVAQVVVPASDARVDDRDADAGAVVAPLLLGGARADRDRRAAIVARDRTVVVNGQDLRALGDRLDHTVRQFDRHAVDELQAAAETAPELPDLFLGVVFLPRFDREDHLGRAKQAARTPLHFLVELFEPLLPSGTLLIRVRLAGQQLGAVAWLRGNRSRKRDQACQHQGCGLPRTLTLSRTHLVASFS